jgi:hypothetical protein
MRPAEVTAVIARIGDTSTELKTRARRKLDWEIECRG